MTARRSRDVFAASVLAIASVSATAAPARAEHLTLDPGARPGVSRPFDADVNVRVDADGFHIGGRVLGLGQSLGAWLRGRVRERGVTLDGQVQGERPFNFRL